MVAIKDMEEMPKSCVTYNSENDNYTGCPFYKICEQRETIKTNYKPTDCPLVEIEERKVGKWIVKDNGNGGIYVECPFCGALAPCTEFADRIVWKYPNFCYDCGNELRGAENE